jgi:hypothetical protein
MYDDDRDWRPEFDDGNVSMTHYSGSDADAVARRKRTFGKRMPINREEVVRLMLQGLHDMGYG